MGFVLRGGGVPPKSLTGESNTTINFFPINIGGDNFVGEILDFFKVEFVSHVEYILSEFFDLSRVYPTYPKSVMANSVIAFQSIIP